MSQIAARVDPVHCSPGTRLSYRLTELAVLAQVGFRFPRLRRWVIGNRMRRLTAPIEYALRTDGYSALPRSISFRPTFLCNARCRMCTYANSIDPDTLQPITHAPEMLSLATACRFADTIAPAHTMLNITGGEPLAWGEPLFHFLDHCRRRGVATSVTTNGTLLGRWLDRLLDSPPDVLIISLLGPAEVHDEIVGLPAFARIEEALTELLARKGGDRFKPPLVITNTAMLPENQGTLPKVVRLAHTLGAGAASFQPLWIATEAMHKDQEAMLAASDRRFTTCHAITAQAMDPKRIWAEMTLAHAQAAKLGQYINFYPRLRREQMADYYQHPELPVGRSRALCAHLISQVLPNGDISPCLGYTVGNLHETDFPAIWNGEAMRAFRRRLRSEGMFPICSRCCVFWRNE